MDHRHVAEISRLFRVEGEFIQAEPYGSGHINDTFAALYNDHGRRYRCLHQRINHNIFKSPRALMENIQRVTEHIDARLLGEGDTDQQRHVLTLIPTQEGDVLLEHETGCWRTYVFIEGAHTYDRVQVPTQAFEAARAFGKFQRAVADLSDPRLHETIPDFHNGPKRFQTFLEVLEKDSCNRAKDAKPEIGFLLENREMFSVLPDLLKAGSIPERITHNDCKFNNVMLDDATSEGACVIDLDTVMPGLIHFDFGDMVRTTTSPTEEDERDLSKVRMEMPMFKALLGGYLSAAGDFLTDTEIDYLPFSGKLITLIIGTRFLTDFLQGDTYFKIHREGHNLDRCRTQFHLVRSMDDQEDEMGRALAKARRESGIAG
ncbi:aminoglycoside phosphotransferase family protein [bacterium]|nr:aminoglycoside phosphotransferase family protein [bacterium]